MLRGKVYLEVVVVGRNEAGAIEEWRIELVRILH